MDIDLETTNEWAEYAVRLERERDEAQFNLDACASECLELRRKLAESAEQLTRTRQKPAFIDPSYWVA